jgi:2-polyprenyl-3-methyl-5-hydroxy-6-metoxy-1,4-benzoquinol methylase
MFSATIDDVRKYWNSRPCNIRHSRAEVGTRQYFDEVEARKYFVEPHIPEFAQFERWRGKKVLEIGCGIGTDSINFARHGAHVTVVDVSAESLALCKKRFEQYGLTARFYQGNAEQLSAIVPVERYDLVYSFGVIHHTPSPYRVIEHIKRYMGPDSELRMMMYSKWCWKTAWIVLRYGKGRFWKAAQLVAEHSEAQTGCPVTYTYSGRDIRNHLLRDFEVRSIAKDHIFPYVIEKYVKHEYERVWYFRFLPDSVFRALERLAGWHMLIVAQPKVSSR